MKKLIMILASLLLALSACTGGPAAGRFGSAYTVTPTPNGSAPSAELQLLLATFTLEGTSQAVTVDQAKVLLPLWQALQALSPGTVPGQALLTLGQPTATPNPDRQAQVDALLRQIQDAMTPDQRTAIAAVDVSWDAALAVMQARGIRFRGLRQTATAMAAVGQALQDTPAPSGANDSTPALPPGGSPAGPVELLTPRLTNVLIELLQERSAGATPAADNVPTATPAQALPAGPIAGNTPFAPAAGPSATPSGPDQNGASSAGDSASSSSSPGPTYRLLGGSDRQTGRTLTASNTGESAVYVANGGSLTLTDSLISTTGNSSSNDPGGLAGLNAGVLAEEGGIIGMSNSRVTASGNGAYGILSTGAGTSVTLSNGTVTTTGQNEPAAAAIQGGTLSLIDVDINTSSSNSDALAAGPGGTITLRNGTVRAYGTNSAGIHSAGDVTIMDSTFIVGGAEAAVIDGAGMIALTDTSLTSSDAGRWGVLIHQGTPGDGGQAQGLFSMTGGSLSYTAPGGPLFYVTGTTALITMRGVSLTVTSGTFVQAVGGSVLLTAERQVLTGNLAADGSGSISITLEIDSSLTGAIDADHTAGAVNLSLDPSSVWTVTADSYLTCLTGTEGTSGAAITNIIGNGHTVYYDRNACPTLSGRTYDLAGGGTLTPE